jgi:hypothetical protein
VSAGGSPYPFLLGAFTAKGAKYTTCAQAGPRSGDREANLGTSGLGSG